MNPLKLVVVGPGLMGKQHIRLIDGNADCTLHAIVAPDHDANHRTAREQNVPLFHSLQVCLDQEFVDGVIISSPNQFHAEQAKICIEAGIPVLIEKPITVSVEDAEEIAEIADKKSVAVLVGHHRAHSPLLSQARDIINEGRLGRLVSVMGSAQFYKPASYFEAGPWRCKPGGGPILINLIHEIGNLRSLCGEITAVQALMSSNVRGFPVEDTAAMNLMFENGMLGTFMLSDTAATAKSWEQTSRENSIYPSYPDEDCYTITGTRGSLSFPTMRMKYYTEDVEPSWLTPFAEDALNVKRYDPLTCQLEHFAKVIRKQCDPLVSAADGLRNLKITEAIRESAHTRQIVYV